MRRIIRQIGNHSFRSVRAVTADIVDPPCPCCGALVNRNQCYRCQLTWSPGSSYFLFYDADNSDVIPLLSELDVIPRVCGISKLHFTCPLCGLKDAVHRRHGVHFDHQVRCWNCEISWEPGETYFYAAWGPRKQLHRAEEVLPGEEI